MEPSPLAKPSPNSWGLWVGLKIQVTRCVLLIPHISVSKMVAPCGVYMLTRVLFLIVSLMHCHGSQMVKNLPAVQEAQVQSLDREGPLERGMATNSSILAWIIPWTEEPGRLHTAHGVAKSRTRLSDWTQHSRSNCVHLQTIWSCPPPALRSKCLISALCFLEKFQVCIKIDQKVHWVLIWLLCLHTHTHTHTHRVSLFFLSLW